MKRKSSILSLFIAVMLVFSLFTGCSSNSVDGPSNGSSPTTSKNVDRAHTLIWAVPATPNGMDHEYHYSQEAMEAQKNLYDSPVYFTLKSEESGFLIPDFADMVPSLAETVDISEDGKTITVKLKEGVMSHAGNELTADDFMYKWERANGLNANIWNFCGLNQQIFDLSQIQKIGEYTFSITTEEINPIGKVFLSHLGQHIFDSVEAKKNATEDDPWATQWMATNGSGYGPYKLVTYAAGDQLVFERHEDYWDKENAGYFEKIIMKEVPQSSNRAAMLISGDVDGATKLTNAELKELEGKPGVKILHCDTNAVIHAGFNLDVDFFKDPRVRQALNYATPSQEIVDSVYMGMARISKSVVPGIYPGYTDEYWDYDTNYEKAKELLAEAGYADGFKTTITIENSVPQIEQMAILLQTGFKKIGVELEIEKLPTADFYNKLPSHSFEGMYIFNDAAGCPDPGAALGIYASDTGVQNHGAWHNDEFMDLYNEMMSTNDNETRMACAKRMQEIVVKEDPIWVYLVEPGYNLALRDDIVNPCWNTLSEIRWNYMSRVEK